jgi:hypothetical protein
LEEENGSLKVRLAREAEENIQEIKALCRHISEVRNEIEVLKSQLLKGKVSDKDCFYNLITYLLLYEFIRLIANQKQ